MNTRVITLIAVLGCMGSPAWAKEPPRAFASRSRVQMTDYLESIRGIKVEIPMVAIPGGTFQIGTPPEPLSVIPHSRPGPVTLTPFWIGKYEIRYSDFTQVEQALSDSDLILHPLPNLIGPKPTTQLDRSILVKLVRTQEYPESRGYSPNYDERMWDQCPVPPYVGVNQWVAKRYCHWLSMITGKFYRLPTEAEWEFACRGGEKNYEEPYPWGTSPARLAEFAITSPKLPADQGRGEDSDPPLPVGSKKPNGYGLHDMLGNAEEWVADGYMESLPYLKQKSTMPLLDPIVWPFGKKHQWKLRHSNETEAMILAQRESMNRPENGWFVTDGLGVAKGGSPFAKDHDSPMNYTVWWRIDRGQLEYETSVYLFSPDTASALEGDYPESVGFRIARPSVVPSRQVQLWHWGIYFDHDKWQDVTLPPTETQPQP